MMIELIQLQPASPIEPDTEYEDELHDINAIIMDLCIALGDTQSFQFRVSGFGDEQWPVDVAADLATVLEQVPRALRACRSGQSFELDFFEQGVQRHLHFVSQGQSYKVHCVSGTSWSPNPQIEVIRRDVATQMLCALKKTFCETCDRLLPRTSAHPWFQEYAKIEL